jgi:hypothetical protein
MLAMTSKLLLYFSILDGVWFAIRRDASRRAGLRVSMCFRESKDSTRIVRKAKVNLDSIQ